MSEMSIEERKEKYVASGIKTDIRHQLCEVIRTADEIADLDNGKFYQYCAGMDRMANLIRTIEELWTELLKYEKGNK